MTSGKHRLTDILKTGRQLASGSVSAHQKAAFVSGVLLENCLPSNSHQNDQKPTLTLSGCAAGSAS